MSVCVVLPWTCVSINEPQEQLDISDLPSFATAPYYKHL
jgi:hypothetical protein